MNDNIFYSPYDGHPLGRFREIPRGRSMRQIKSDFNSHLNKFCKSKTKAQ